MVTENDINPYSTKSITELVMEADPNIVKGVYVPWDVQIQLREAGILASQLLRGELREANAADCTGQVINDPGGTSFMDKLHRTADENRKNMQPDDDDDDSNPDLDDDGGKKHNPRALAQDQRRKSFVQELLEQRAEQLKHMTDRVTSHLF